MSASQPPKYSPPTLILPIIFVLAGLLLTVHAADAQAVRNYVNMNYWPVDAQYAFVIAYPDSAWTWSTLGINPGQTCPPYRMRSRESSQAYWRDPDIPEEDDWAQASRGREFVLCYLGHRGTDIATRPGARVYAVADGVVHLATEGKDEEGENGQVVIAHHRVVDGVIYDWEARYLHLRNFFPARSGPVREGQLIGYVADRKSNTHLHFGVEGLWNCWSPCILNPWGPVYLWIDDDFNRLPDPAPSVLAHAPEEENLLANGSLETGDISPWLVLPDTAAQIDTGTLHLSRRAGSIGWTSIEQYMPYALDAGSPFEISLSLGNTSDTTRYVDVSLRSAQSPITGYTQCTFTLPPNTPLTTYFLRGRTGSRWSNFILAISVSPAGGKPAIVVDDMSVMYKPGMKIGRDGCTKTP
ncbi:MAG: M23 family metallopeptidase [Anaerolineae bacterium]|nr:M23 family metallopeptidase [Anaerolineae bacterium]